MVSSSVVDAIKTRVAVREGRPAISASESKYALARVEVFVTVVRRQADRNAVEQSFDDDP
jgi:hypothetical protein